MADDIVTRLRWHADPAQSGELRPAEVRDHLRAAARREGAEAGYAAAIHDALAAVREVHSKAADPTPLHKGIRMACASIGERMEALADAPRALPLPGDAEAGDA